MKVRLLLVFVLSVVIVGVMASINVCANDDNVILSEHDRCEAVVSNLNNEVEINETTFPEQKFRDFVKSDKSLSIKKGEGSETKYYVNTEADELAIPSMVQCSDITGIEYFSKLETIKISGNPISEFDINLFPEIKYLDVSYTNLKELNIKEFKNLEELKAIGCDDLQTLKVSVCKNLESLMVSESSVNSIDISFCCMLNYFSVIECRSLKTLTLLDVDIKTLYVASLYSLEELSVEKTQSLEEVVANDCVLLKNINIDQCKNLCKLYIEKTNNIETFYLRKANNANNGKGIEKLDFTECKKLKEFSVNNSRVNEINVNGCVELSKLELNNIGQFKMLCVACTKITSLNIEDFYLLEKVDISNCKLLQSFRAPKNYELRELDASNSSELEVFDIYNCYNIIKLNINGCPKLKDVTYYSENWKLLKAVKN